MMPKHEDVLCPTCGGYVKVGGERTTHYYIPVLPPAVDRLVEAAGKVDKEAAQTWFAWLPKGVRGYGEKTIRALLDALPDKGE
jgi:hypothetical protein